MTWWGAILLGAIGGASVWPVHRFALHRFGIDDVCGVFAVHGSAGYIGAVLIPFLGVSGGSWAFLGVDQVAMQFAGATLILGWTVLASAVCFRTIDALIGLRVSADAERAGLDQSEHHISSYPEFGAGTGVTDSADSDSDTGDDTADETVWRGETVESTDVETEPLLGRTLEGLTEPTVIVDESGTMQNSNSAALRLFQTTEQAALDTEPTAFVDGDSPLDTVLEAVLETKRTPEDRRGTLTVNETTTPVRVSATPLYDGEAFIGAHLTITEIEAELEAQVEHERLEARRGELNAYREQALDQHRVQLHSLPRVNST